jgi:hypothetical protein
MPTARKQFQVVQGGTVATWDAGTVATMIFAAVNDIHYRPANEVKTADTLRGNLIMSDGADNLGKMGEAYIGGLLSYEDAPYMLESSYGHVTPGTAGTAVGGTAFSRVYTPAGTAEDVPMMRRLEFGQVGNSTLQGYIPSAVIGSFEVAGKVRDWVMFTSQWWGPEYVAGTITAGLSKRTIERAKAGNTAFYIDNPVGGTIGTTAVTDCVTAFSWKSGTIWDPKNCIQNSLIVTGFSQHPIQPTCDLTIQSGTLTEQLKAKYQAGSAVYLRVDNLGGTIGTAGTVQKTWRGEMTGQIMGWTEEGNTEDQNGLVVTVTFTGVDDLVGVFGRCCRYTIINQNATLA